MWQPCPFVRRMRRTQPFCMELEPPLLTRYPRRFHAVRGTQLPDGFREVVAHRAFREEELLGDVAAAQALAREPEHLALPVVQGVGAVPGLGGELRGDGLAAALHGADGL